MTKISVADVDMADIGTDVDMTQVRMGQIDMTKVSRYVGMASIETDIFVTGIERNVVMMNYNMACISNRCIFGCISKERCIMLCCSYQLSSVGLGLSNSAKISRYCHIVRCIDCGRCIS